MSLSHPCLVDVLFRSCSCVCQFFAAISLLTVTLYRLCLVSVLFWYYFNHILFFLFSARNIIIIAIMQKIFLYKVYTNLAYLFPTYSRLQKLWVLIINNDVHKSLVRKKGDDILIWSWIDSIILDNCMMTILFLNKVTMFYDYYNKPHKIPTAFFYYLNIFEQNELCCNFVKVNISTVVFD